MASIIREIQEATGAQMFVRSELGLYGPYLEWLRTRQKVTTIRFRKGAVEVPYSHELPLFETAEVGTATMDMWVNPLIVQLGAGVDF